jgi:hypothetical protein
MNTCYFKVGASISHQLALTITLACKTTKIICQLICSSHLYWGYSKICLHFLGSFPVFRVLSSSPCRCVISLLRHTRTDNVASSLQPLPSNREWRTIATTYSRWLQCWLRGVYTITEHERRETKHMSGTTFEEANQIIRLKLWDDLDAICWVKREFIDRLVCSEA